MRRGVLSAGMSRRRAPENPEYERRWSAVITAAGDPPTLDYQPPNAPLSVIYQDAHLLALDKPALLLTVPGKAAELADCLEARAQAEYPDARIVHRLDRPTSGVVVMARNPAAHRHLGLQFERRRLAKTYVARVAGRPTAAQGVIDAGLCGDWPRRPRQMVSRADGKPAITRFTRLCEEPGDVSRLALEPLTGRTHQLRCHLAWIGLPILGDEFYAPPDARAAADRLQLHAETLSLRHPATGEPLTLRAPCPF